MMDADTRRSIDSTAQHVRLISDRIDKLDRRRRDAFAQVLNRIGVEYRAGAITLGEMIDLYAEMRDLGVSADWWGRATGLSYQDVFREKCRRQVIERNKPNGPEGSWVGPWPMPEGFPRPPKGTPVVYVLFDEFNTPCYVGSTGDFRTRVGIHAKGKRFASWQAHPCRDRDDAYAVEDRVLKQHKPHMNGRAGR